MSGKRAKEKRRVQQRSVTSPYRGVDFTKGSLTTAWIAYSKRTPGCSELKPASTDDFERDFDSAFGAEARENWPVFRKYITDRVRDIVDPAIARLLSGMPVEGAIIDAGTNARGVHFIIPIGTQQDKPVYGRRIFKNVPKTLSRRITIELVEYVKGKVPANQYFLESMVPEQILETITGKSEAPTGELIPFDDREREIKAVVDQQMIDHLETASDLCRFYDRFKNDSKRVAPVYVKRDGTETLLGYRLYPESIEEATADTNSKGLDGKAAMDFKNNVIAWSRKELKIPWVYKNEGGRQKRKLLQGFKIIPDFLFEDGKPLMVQISALLLVADTEYGYKMMPSNMREINDRYRKKPGRKRQITRVHKKAWMHLFTYSRDEIFVRDTADLMVWWGVPYGGDTRKTGRRWDRFYSILDYLVDTGLCIEVKRLPLTKPERVRFHMNPAIATHVGVPKRLLKEMEE